MWTGCRLANLRQNLAGEFVDHFRQWSAAGPKQHGKMIDARTVKPFKMVEETLPAEARAEPAGRRQLVGGVGEIEMKGADEDAAIQAGGMPKPAEIRRLCGQSIKVAGIDETSIHVRRDPFVGLLAVAGDDCGNRSLDGLRQEVEIGGYASVAERQAAILPGVAQLGEAPAEGLATALEVEAEQRIFHRPVARS